MDNHTRPLILTNVDHGYGQPAGYQQRRQQHELNNTHHHAVHGETYLNPNSVPTLLNTSFDGHASTSAYTYGESVPNSAASGFSTASSLGLPSPRDPSPGSSSLHRSSHEPLPVSPTAPLKVEKASVSSAHVTEPPKKKKKNKDRVALATDQPLTSQGKERQRVYLACVQCRQRKIRCDGAKPTCEVCVRRGITACSYDTAPKRRGPDRYPGARQRLRGEESVEPEEVGPVRRRRRRRSDDDLPTPVDGPSQILYPPYREPPGQPQSTSIVPPQMNGYHIPSPVDIIPPVSVPVHSARTGLYQYATDQVAHEYGQYAPVNYHAAPVRASAYITEEDEERSQHIQHGYHIAPEPTMDLLRDTWWDSLLAMYGTPREPWHQSGVVSTRAIALEGVTKDLRFFFRYSNYWISFFHAQSFLDAIYHPDRRSQMQPALVFATLAFSTLLQSSERGLGAAGRETALRLRDAAKGQLEASIATRWINDELAQAAFILALFEISGHEGFDTQRARDSIVVLDGIIRILALTQLDSDDPQVTTFAPPAVLPAIPNHSHSLTELRKDFYGASRSELAASELREPVPAAHTWNYRMQYPNLASAGQVHTHGRAPCQCLSLTHGARAPHAKDQTPAWIATAAWSAEEESGQMRKEACRRLCWSALAVASGHTSYASAITGNSLDLWITNPANYSLLFNGEAVSRSVIGHKGKDTVWALYNRLMLLWHACLRLRVDQSLAFEDKAQLAMAAWLELDAIEASLDSHTCDMERSFMYQGREVIFNTRMVISYEYQKFIPDAMTNFNGFFHRAKAEEWLRCQLTMAAGVISSYRTQTGIQHSALMYRPFFILWFMAQVSRCLMLWRVDASLTLALEVAEKWLPPIDYLLGVWPSAPIRQRYDQLRQNLEEACALAGRHLPPPVDLSMTVI